MKHFLEYSINYSESGLFVGSYQIYKCIKIRHNAQEKFIYKNSKPIVLNGKKNYLIILLKITSLLE